MIKDILNKSEEKMLKSISVLKKDLGSMKAGKANPAMLDRVNVEYYGSETPINQLANVSSPEPRVLLIQPWDKNSLKDIEKAILQSDLGLNPSNDGSVIRLIIPELTEETRKDIVKKVKKIGEESKIAIRSIRREGNDKIKNLKKNNDITEDEAKEGESSVQKITDKYITEIDNIVSAKEKEVMSV
ncbi:MULTISPECIES: ribosome recycling factor [Clostridium]|uniref:Ribosome-recycling factor n=1 Tax=Clostridium novyi (strain NT) TaxID=386415 RepID=RRF_CLONN|nr:MULTISPECIES: ribosome recycling factor [Clostridium]A0Q0R7.1 RecName: Full=Ribosome-recycling factor; Short=RRF; AltName: Full=Ribosome-releasing factor [Clostridium novyi NT]ABK60857.1 ribosome recycling factor [Clostridium novyi NT]KEH88594.1 ribosome recycling factor [Clostridium novyi A str. NCTC 538]KEH89533.1 ribosome recycling factor [Clostridium novyi A str. 4540]KEH90696.1 ribosome recycling factor [Clostridium novyi A str. BKT29909]KEH94490.1 ribosome recycling factor [Clostridi